MPTRNNKGDIDRKNVKLAISLTIFFISLLFFNFLVISFVFTWADWLATLI
ncbi:unnamed protein product, partial [marine sediment metagenome]